MQKTDYGTDTDNQIRDEILQKCKSNYLRRKLLEEGPGLTLARTLELAQQCEKVEAQMTSLPLHSTEHDRNNDHPVNRVASTANNRDQRSRNSRRPRATPQKESICYRCGHTGHYGRDPACPARGKTCSKCGGINHFATVCKSKSNGTRQVRLVQPVSGDECDDEPAYAFHLPDSGNRGPTINANLGGVELQILVDSGATKNIVDETTWEWLKQNRIRCESKAAHKQKKLYPYASTTPQQVKGTFTTTVQIGAKEITTEFLVIKGKGTPLLGHETATLLDVLRIGPVVSAISSVEENLQQQYPEVYNGIGKLNTKQITLHIDPTIKPVAQPLRRTPFNLRSQVEKKISELIEADIIEPVDGPTPWVNPVVVVPKSNDEIRLCIDMRRANEAIVRGRHPIPTVDEILQGMNSSKIFSKLGLKWGYHQLELSPKSREITTFATHTGLYRYKRLLFGVCSASEQYQHEISTVLAGITGAENISDDIVVHGADQESHDRSLHAVLERLQVCGLTLNPEKCQYNMNRIVFMGMLLSDKGIGPTSERVKAVTGAREPQTTAELRCFLGLVSYSSCFIPQFSTISEPLRKLTKKDVPFIFGAEQRASFQALKDSLSRATTLAYFDKHAPTKVIADASPVGPGAVLTQVQDGNQVPICYASRSLTACEQRYSQTEREALALVWACERFHPYIYGTKFELLTDHKPLEAIYNPRSRPSARVERWARRLQPYDFKVVYIPGQQNVADSLSRLLPPHPKPAHHHGADEYVQFVTHTSVPNAMSLREVEEATIQDDELTAVKQAIGSGRFEQCKPYMPVAGELCISGQLVLRGTRIVLPSKLRPQALALAREGHLGIVGTKQNLRSKVYWPGMDKAAEKHCKSCHGCQLVAQPNPPEPIRSTALPDAPWQHLAANLMGPFPSGHSILVVVDYYSRFYEYEILRSTTTDKVIDAMEEMFSRHGLPLTIKTDNGPQFKAAEFNAYCTANCITHVKVTPKWAQANGEVERQN